MLSPRRFRYAEAPVSAQSSPAAAALAGRLSYAQCWEDWQVLTAALDVGEGDDVLSIASAGDNSFALVLAGARVVAVDLSFPQIALCELKLAATTLEYEAYLAFLGLGVEPDRQGVYQKLRPLLSEGARAYWDAHGDTIAAGLLGAGKFERYLATFRRHVLPLVHGRALVDELCALDDPARQRALYDARWNTWRWRALFKVFFSRAVMGRTGRTAAHFAHVEGAVSTRLLARTAHVLSDLPVRSNPYVQWILRGTFPDLELGPPYLTRRGHAGLRERRDRIQLVHGELERFLPAQPRGAFSAFNYSNLFEYVSVAQHEALLRATLGAARPGARVAYWNLLVARHRPAALADALERRESSAATWLERDRAFVYGGFNLEIVRG